MVYLCNGSSGFPRGPAHQGGGTKTTRSNRPGRRSAGSTCQGALVAASIRHVLIVRLETIHFSQQLTDQSFSRLIGPHSITVSTNGFHFIKRTTPPVFLRGLFRRFHAAVFRFHRTTYQERHSIKPEKKRASHSPRCRAGDMRFSTTRRAIQQDPPTGAPAVRRVYIRPLEGQNDLPVNGFF